MPPRPNMASRGWLAIPPYACPSDFDTAGARRGTTGWMLAKAKAFLSSKNSHEQPDVLSSRHDDHLLPPSPPRIPSPPSSPSNLSAWASCLRGHSFRRVAMATRQGGRGAPRRSSLDGSREPSSGKRSAMGRSLRIRYSGTHPVPLQACGSVFYCPWTCGAGRHSFRRRQVRRSSRLGPGMDAYRAIPENHFVAVHFRRLGSGQEKSIQKLDALSLGSARRPRLDCAS